MVLSRTRMTNLIGQEAKEAHRLLLRGQLQIILDMEVFITYIIQIHCLFKANNQLICLVALCKSIIHGYDSSTYFCFFSFLNPKQKSCLISKMFFKAHLNASGISNKFSQTSLCFKRFPSISFDRILHVHRNFLASTFG